MKFKIITLGCKVNTYESNVIKDCLENHGYLEDNDARTANLDNWLPAYLMVAVIIAIQFAQEIDPNDDSEMQKYLFGN